MFCTKIEHFLIDMIKALLQSSYEFAPYQKQEYIYSSAPLSSSSYSFVTISFLVFIIVPKLTSDKVKFIRLKK